MLMKWRTFSERDSGGRRMAPNWILTLKCSWPGKVVDRMGEGRVKFVAVVVVWRRDGMRVAMTGDCWDGEGGFKASNEGDGRTAAEAIVAAAVRSTVCILDLIVHRRPRSFESFFLDVVEYSILYDVGRHPTFLICFPRNTRMVAGGG